MRRIWVSLIIFVLLAIAVFVTVKNPNKKLDNNNINKNSSSTPTAKEEISPTVPPSISETLINEQLKSYLPKILESSYGGQVFCSHYLYGFDEDKTTNIVKAYVWVYCEEYYQENGQLKMGSGVSEPLLITLELQNGKLGIQGYEEPGNGSLYASSIKKMFPDKYVNEAINGYQINQLKPSPKEQAESFYKDNQI